ncbi:MAG TPA: MipA/OmpV family protein [Steroidobacteraceae bacterium]
MSVRRSAAAAPTLLAAALALAGTPSLGAGTADTAAQRGTDFDTADANHDGRVSLQEFEDYVIARLMAGHGPYALEFQRWSPGQRSARLERRFEALDTGHKGYLDRSDWKSMRALLAGARHRSGGVPRPGLGLGAGLAEVNPGYVGYHRRIDAFPLISYRSGRFFLSGTTAGVVAVQNEAYSASLVLRPEFTRVRASDSPELAGLSTRQWTIDGGVQLGVTQPWGKLSLAAVHDVLDRNNGTDVSLGYAYPIALGAGRRLTPGLGVAWESAALTGYYYGVSAAEALPGRPEYSPGAALDPSARLDFELPLSSQWRLGAGVRYTRFDRAIRDSPLIDQSGSLALSVSLQWSAVTGR